MQNNTGNHNTQFSKQKTLLAFAHRGEAEAFLKQGRFKALPFSFKGLYESEREMLLLTGEGIHSVIEKLGAVCAAFHQNISEIINLGIAGSLNNEVELGKIYAIRMILREGVSPNSFPVFRSADVTAQTDCITAEKRVLEKSYAARLASFAPVVDRELWAIASLCSRFGLPFRSYKLISDRAGEDAETLNIKRRATEYSARLYEHYRACERDLLRDTF